MSNDLMFKDFIGFLQEWSGPTGVVGVIIVYCSSFLEKRHFKTYKASLDKKLKEYENELQSTRDKLNKIMESEVYAKKIIFDKEFSIYEGLWDLITDLEKETHGLLQTFEEYEKSKCTAKEKIESKSNYIKYYNNTNYKIRKFAPFIPSELYEDIGCKLGAFKWTIQNVEVSGNEKEHLAFLDENIKEVRIKINQSITAYIKNL